MAANPPFSITSISITPGSAPPEKEYRNAFCKEFDPNKELEVPVTEPFNCKGESCSVEKTRKNRWGDEWTEPYHPRSLVRSFDKWDLYQCESCGGFIWSHNARADYL